MADDNSIESQREARAKEIEADALLAEMDKHAKATKVADGLQSTRAARDAIRKGRKG